MTPLSEPEFEPQGPLKPLPPTPRLMNREVLSLPTPPPPPPHPKKME